FNIKPFALMTQHPAEMSRLPKQLREMVPAEERTNRQLTRPAKEVIDMAFQMFWSSMAPLREAGKLGMVAFQFPVGSPRELLPEAPTDPDMRISRIRLFGSRLRYVTREVRRRGVGSG